MRGAWLGTSSSAGASTCRKSDGRSTPGAIHRHRCTAAFALSDHADYPGLLTFVERVQPKRVFTVHGFAQEFAATLRQRGTSTRSRWDNPTNSIFSPPRRERRLAPGGLLRWQ